MKISMRCSMNLCWDNWSFKAFDSWRRSSKLGIFELKKAEPLSVARILLRFSPGGTLQAFPNVEVRSQMNSSLLRFWSFVRRRNFKWSMPSFSMCTISVLSFDFKALGSKKAFFSGNTSCVDGRLLCCADEPVFLFTGPGLPGLWAWFVLSVLKKRNYFLSDSQAMWWSGMIYFHIILHPAVHIYDFHIFLTLSQAKCTQHSSTESKRLVQTSLLGLGLSDWMEVLTKCIKGLRIRHICIYIYKLSSGRRLLLIVFDLRRFNERPEHCKLILWIHYFVLGILNPQKVGV